MRGSQIVLLAALAIAAVGCADTAGSPVLADVATCSPAWQPITAPAEKGSYSPLVFAGGSIYYSTETDGDIRALSPMTGQETVIDADNWAQALWVEGDHLLFSEESRFFSLPLSGGPAQLLFDGLPADPKVEPPLSELQAVSATDVVWIEQGGSGNLVKRASRSGGDAVTIGTVDQLVYDGIALTPTTVLLATDLGHASAVSLDGSGVLPLAAGGHWFTAVTPDGAYWMTETGLETAAMMFSPANGGPSTPFWPGIPYGVGPWRMWPDGKGGWVVSATELFSDQLYHGAIWFLAGDGSARLAACDPVGGTNAAIVSVQPAIADDAIYFPALAGSSLQWTIVRVAR